MPQGTSRKSAKVTAAKRATSASLKNAPTKKPLTKSKNATPGKVPAKEKAGNKSANRPLPKSVSNNPEAVRQRIVSAALTLFAKSGFDGTTITQISREAGVVSPLIYYYFADKDELWRASADFAISDWGGNLGPSQKELTDADPVTIMKVQVRRYIYFVARHREFGRLIINEAGTGHERLKWLITRHILPLHSSARESVEKAVADGLVRKGVTPAFLNQFVIGGVSHFMNSRLMLMSIYGVDPNDEDTIDAFADFVIDFVFSWLLTEKGRGR